MKLRRFYSIPAYVGIVIVQLVWPMPMVAYLLTALCILWADTGGYANGMQAGKEIYSPPDE